MLKSKGEENDEKGELTTREQCLSMVTQKVKQLWKDKDTVEKKLEALTLALSESAESIPEREEYRLVQRE